MQTKRDMTVEATILGGIGEEKFLKSHLFGYRFFNWEDSNKFLKENIR